MPSAFLPWIVVAQIYVVYEIVVVAPNELKI